MCALVTGVQTCALPICLRERVDRGRAGTAGHAIAGLHERIDRRILAHHLRIAATCAGEGRTDDGYVMLQLVRRQRIAQLGIGLLPPERCVGLDHRPPLGIERLVGLQAGDEEAMDWYIALTLEPLLRPSLSPGPYRAPDAGRLPPARK